MQHLAESSTECKKTRVLNIVHCPTLIVKALLLRATRSWIKITSSKKRHLQQSRQSRNLRSWLQLLLTTLICKRTTTQPTLRLPKSSFAGLPLRLVSTCLPKQRPAMGICPKSIDRFAIAHSCANFANVFSLNVHSNSAFLHGHFTSVKAACAFERSSKSLCNSLLSCTATRGHCSFLHSSGLSVFLCHYLSFSVILCLSLSFSAHAASLKTLQGCLLSLLKLVFQSISLQRQPGSSLWLRLPTLSDSCDQA